MAETSSRAPMTSQATAHPSLALVKYWGKQKTGVNLPATGSVAVSLQDLITTTTATLSERDEVIVDGVLQNRDRFEPILNEVRKVIRGAPAGAGDGLAFHISSTNSFPTAAGLASSASGFAALTAATLGAAGKIVPEPGGAIPEDTLPLLSRVARIGSGSAARSIFGGFVLWDAGEQEAQPYRPADWWPELRIVVFPLSAARKTISSREAMTRTRETSPFYPAWVEDAPALVARCRDAIDRRDIEALGTVMRLSYLRMFGTMIAANPPVLYWLPSSMEALHRLQELRGRGFPAWETMDAGPQVKVVTLAEHAEMIVSSLQDLCVDKPVVSAVGGPTLLTTQSVDGQP